MGLQIKVSDKDGRVTEIISVVNPTLSGGAWTYTDEDGDRLHVATGNSPASGWGIVVASMKPAGVYIPLDQVEEFVTQVRDIARQAQEERDADG